METVKKFQWSIMFGGEQIVIRTDNKEEFDTLRAEYKKSIGDIFNPPMNTDEEKLSNFVADYESDAKKCQKCGAALIAGTTKTGKTYLKCSTNKWDRVAKKETGCDFIKWL